MGKTKIEWATHTWNPITGCSRVSPGCIHCYAERQAKRFAGRFGYPKDDPFKVTFHPDKLEQPVRWKKPRRIFVCSMGDLYHPDVTPQMLESVFSVMTYAKQHTYMILTKRPERVRLPKGFDKLFPHIWIGVTAENQEQWDKRVPILRKIKAAVRFVSVEPMLEEIDADVDGLDWVICGGENGAGARFFHIHWAQILRDDCYMEDVPFFYKPQRGLRIPIGLDIQQTPRV